MFVSCASLNEIHIGAGGRGSLTFGTDHVDPTHPFVDEKGRGAAAVDVSLGVERVQLVAGRECTPFEGDHFRATLLGVRAYLQSANRAEGIYAMVLGRDVEDAPAETPFFDGFDAALGVLFPVARPLFLDANLGWTVIDGHAIRSGRENTSELRIALGLRLAF